MISQKEYAKRRKKLLKKLPMNSISVLLSATPKVRSHDTEYPYRQNSNFYYLSGLEEDNAALLLLKTKEGVASYLFVIKKDPQMELWNGKRLGVERSKEFFSVDDVFEITQLSEKITAFGESCSHFLYDFHEEKTRINPLFEQLKNVQTYSNVASFIEELRLVKSQAEIALIKKALRITQEAHHRIIKVTPKLHFEYEVQAEIEYVFCKRGAKSDAYTSIVASGNNANTLHYISNDKELDKKSLILIDAGCEYQYYASDITRTIPRDGTFTKAQKELYSLVLDVNKKIISMIRPGVLRSELQKKSEELLTRGMLRLGILDGELKKNLESKAFKKYYPHGIGHWMGIDVHDEAPYKDREGKELPLQKGMVLTIEPGIYLDEDDIGVPKKYRGIGIRIEDDILVTKEGYENLSQEIVKELRDMESLASS